MSDTQSRVLVVEDDAAIGRSVELELGHAGYSVMRVTDGLEAVGAVKDFNPDLVVLDLMLPGRDGLEIANDLRTSGDRRPILMLTARSQTQDVVAGLEAGADDYLRKPFEIEELLSRVRALLRRIVPAEEGSRFVVGDVEINPASRTVTVAGQEIEFTAKEYDLLEYFVSNAGRVMTRDEILTSVWTDQTTTDSNKLEVFVCHLRNKLGDQDNQLIRTIRGVGYFFSRP